MRGSKKIIKFLQNVRGSALSGSLAICLCLMAGCDKSPQDSLTDGERHLADKNYPKAVEAFEKAAGALPNNANAWNKLGMAHQYLGNFLEAREAYLRTIEIDRTLPDVYYNFGNLLLDHDQLAEAVNYLKNYCFLVPDSARGHLSLAMAQRKSGMIPEAIESLNKARLLEKNDPNILNELALAYYHNNDPAQAMTYLRYITDQFPDFAPAVLNTAVILQNSGDQSDLALQTFRQYLTMNPPADKAAKVREIIAKIENQLVVSESDNLPALEDVLPQKDNSDIFATDSEQDTQVADANENEIETEDLNEKVLPELTFVDSDENPVLFSDRRHSEGINTGTTPDDTDKPGDEIGVVSVPQIRDPANELPEAPERSNLPEEEAVVSTQELPRPDLEMVPGSEYSRPPVPKPYGVMQTFNGRPVLIVPVTPEPVEFTAPPAAQAGYEYPYKDIERLLAANEKVLMAYGLQPTRRNIQGANGNQTRLNENSLYRQDPVPDGVTPLEPLAPVQPDSLENVRTLGTPDYFQDDLTDPDVDLGRMRRLGEQPKSYAVVDPSDANDSPAAGEPGDLPPVANPTGNLQVSGNSSPRVPAPDRAELSNYPRYDYINPEVPAEGDRLLARPYFDDGVNAYRAGKLDYAIEYFSSAVQQDPSWYEPWYNLGVIYLRTRQPLKALNAIEHAISLRPENIELHYHLGQALTNSGYIPDAIEEFQKVLNLKPDHVGVHFALASIYEKELQNISSARVHYSRILEIQPAHPQSTNIRYWLRDNK